MNQTKPHIAFCGLDCSKCDAFVATQKDDNRLRVKTAKDWTERYRKGKRNRPPVRPEEINCAGCLSAGPVYSSTRKPCALSTGMNGKLLSGFRYGVSDYKLKEALAS